MNPTPTPSAIILEQLRLLHQIQTHTIPLPSVLLLAWSLALPIPIEIRINIYHVLFSIMSFLHLSSFVVVLLVLFWPLWIIISLIITFFLVRFLIKFFYFGFPYLFYLLSKKRIKKVFLQVTFPSETSKSAYATQQFYALLHNLSSQKSFKESLAHLKKIYSLEIVATKKDGIRYLLVANAKDADTIKRSILSYLPGVKIQEVFDYLDNSKIKGVIGIVELELSNHFALPLQQQSLLSLHDPIGYLAGNMTQLENNELIAFQIIATPITTSTHNNVNNELKALRYSIHKSDQLKAKVQKLPLDVFLSLPIISIFWFVVKLFVLVFKYIFLFTMSIIPTIMDTSRKPAAILTMPEIKTPAVVDPYEQELQTIVKEKIDQLLFETSIRIFVQIENREEMEKRISGLLAAFGPMSTTYQSIRAKRSFLGFLSFKSRLRAFRDRFLSQNIGLNGNPILSVREIADLYHFPYAGTTKTEDIAKVMSQELPTPLLLKNTNFDVVFGKNSYGNIETPIGLTDDDRSRHVYLLGQTGSGKTTIIYHMAKDDIQKGRGLAVIDPHGDLAEDLLEVIPLSRKDDLIYFNPFDLKYPIGMNLLELTDGLDDDALELEKELVTEGVISIFRRVFSDDEKSNAHRIEYILRNTIYTSFTIPGRTIFTIYDLLNNPEFQRKVIKNLTDQNLQNFWKFELGRAGSYQIVKMASGVTAKVGRFLFSPTAKRILEQPKSTINFDEIINSGKILICNFAEGKLGEDTSQLLGTMILSKLQQAVYRRARINSKIRKPFYLYVDEFQTFATSSFTKILSGGRKFGLRIAIAEQSTTQQSDKNITNTILANTGTVICFRTSSPIDEDFMLTQFRPLVEKGDIANLPRYHFYIKLAALEPQGAFSGETLPIVIKRDQKKIEELIAASRKNWAAIYVKNY